MVGRTTTAETTTHVLIKYFDIILSPGPTLTFNDEIASIRYEVTVLQAAGVNKIIALGHAGHTMDKEIANIDGIDVVVGGHTDTFLYTCNTGHRM
ncbi:hypothetical protein DPMN_073787 [Dreissena polymorpha]|uniref:5'-nucleotidase n=1 Tax=Dreissena polymorpha TaxID=45954 RepID=A0A9D4HBM4_DREPO|nr:hypothetical protein DPMN_073787 [Dreissena polymorpha]